MHSPWIIHWSFDPIAFQFGVLTFRWYGLCWLVAFLQAEYLTRRVLAHTGQRNVDVSALAVTPLVGTNTVARLAHCLFYEPAYYLSHPLKILAIWEGGLASHGGVVGFIVAIAWGARRYAKGVSLLALLDAVSLPAALGGAIVRVANFLNSEILGVPTSGSWGVIFDRVDQQPRIPVQLFEAVSYVLIAVFLFWQYKRRDALDQPGRLTGWFLALVFGVRTILESWKAPQAAYDAGELVSVGQWLSVPFILVGVLLMWRCTKTNEGRIGER